MTTKNRKNEYKLTHKGFNVLTLALTTKEIGITGIYKP